MSNSPIPTGTNAPDVEQYTKDHGVPVDNHAGNVGSAPVVVVGTPNTLRPPVGFPKFLYPFGNPAAGAGILCANQEIADDWAKRGYASEDQAEKVADFKINVGDDAQQVEPKLMDHQHAIDAPPHSAPSPEAQPPKDEIKPAVHKKK